MLVDFDPLYIVRYTCDVLSLYTVICSILLRVSIAQLSRAGSGRCLPVTKWHCV